VGGQTTSGEARGLDINSFYRFYSLLVTADEAVFDFPSDVSFYGAEQERVVFVRGGSVAA
jgi:hypothetical protein